MLRAACLPLWPLGWLLDQAALLRFRGDRRREFARSFPPRQVRVVGTYLVRGWPAATIEIYAQSIDVWSHMGEFGVAVDLPRDPNPFRCTFSSLPELAGATVEYLRRFKLAEQHENASASAQPGAIR